MNENKNIVYIDEKTFPDDNLRKVISKNFEFFIKDVERKNGGFYNFNIKINKDFIDLTQCNVVRLEFLNDNIKSLEGLQNFKDLKYLNIRDDYIKDLSPIKELTNLQDLELSCLQLEEESLGFLNSLKNLKSLTLKCGDLKAKDLEFLSSLENLEYLDLSHNPYLKFDNAHGDLFKNNTKLKELRLNFCGVCTFAFLKPLENINYLSLNTHSFADSIVRRIERGTKDGGFSTFEEYKNFLGLSEFSDNQIINVVSYLPPKTIINFVNSPLVPAKLGGKILEEGFKMNLTYSYNYRGYDKNPQTDAVLFVKHPLFPKDTLVELADSKYKSICVAVAKNPECPVELLEKLSSAYYREIRIAVARHPNTPKEILNKLLKDETSSIKKVAEASLNKLEAKEKENKKDLKSQLEFAKQKARSKENLRDLNNEKKLNIKL